MTGAERANIRGTNTKGACVLGSMSHVKINGKCIFYSLSVGRQKMENASYGNALKDSTNFKKRKVCGLGTS